MMMGMVFKKKKGSSSIMVILIMLILVIFGVLALMSSYSNLKLAKKNADWLEKYYGLDAKGEKLVSQIDLSLKQAFKKAEIGKALNKGRYMNFVENEIKAIKTEDRLYISKNSNKLTISSKLIDINKNMLSIGLEVSTPYTGKHKGPFKYYKVTRWEQLPKEFKYDNTFQLWNGEVNKP